MDYFPKLDNLNKGQEVKLDWVDISGRAVLSKIIKWGTVRHQKEIDMTRQFNGLYLRRVNIASKLMKGTESLVRLRHEGFRTLS